MSDPQTNVQIEDVLSSIRRLVSEEIGQMPARKPVKVVEEEEQKLVLSPAQKIEEAAAKDDLWEATQELAPQDPAPVWWHREVEAEPEKPEDPFILDADTMAAPAASDQDDVLQAVMDEVETAAPETTAATTEPVAEAPAVNAALSSSLGSALAGLKAARSLQDDDWEPPEGEDDLEEGVQFGSMPWEDEEAEDIYAGSPAPETQEAVAESVEAPETSAEPVDEPEDIPFRFRPGERLYERLSNKPMQSEAPEEPKFKHAEPRPEPILEDARMTGGDADTMNIFDEDMLRDMVSDIVRQELQGVLGERITRNVRKLVRREIQRALSDLNQ